MLDNLNAGDLSLVIVAGCMATLVGAVLIALAWTTF